MKNLAEKQTLTADQQKIFEQITKKLQEIVKINMPWDSILSLSGAAGTGKTYLTTQIVKYLDENKLDVIVTAPTHKALSVLRNELNSHNLDITCKTLHSFLNIKLFKDYNKGTQKFIVDKKTKDTMPTLESSYENLFKNSDIWTQS